mmetsp:Transcript_30356/g.54992  ORF Transcript_30356/g.54992 Transcript_30356/m.54992 type:complete len:882 (-) Transcript_30356:141-2786(-)
MSVDINIINAATVVASSSEETLLLTQRGEVLVCRHLDYSKRQDYDEEELNRLRSDDRHESENYGRNSPRGKCGLVDSKVLCCTAEKEFGGVTEGNVPTSKDVGITVLRKCMRYQIGTKEENSKIRKPKGKSRYPRSTSIQQPGDEGNMSLRSAECIFQDDYDGRNMFVASSKGLEEHCVMTEVNGIRLRNHANFLFHGDNSPTPVMSFDYHGYEPPTPEPIQNNHAVSFIHSPGLIDHGPADSDNMMYFATSSNLRIQKREPLYLIQPGTKACEQHCPLPSASDPSFALSGVPTFLHPLSQIRITNLSAHPRGHHVLLVSEEGLLFSYGSNNCGQLGLGKQSFRRSNFTVDGDGKHCDQVTVPSIVTPLLENGGKTINCAAGIDYSLVVVKTEGARIAHRKRQHQQQASQNLNSHGEHSSNSASNHHQMYGFGNNYHRKLGLLDPTVSRCNSLSNNCNGSPRRDHCSGRSAEARRSLEALSPSPLISSLGSLADDSTDGVSETDYVYLPRRVALHCKVIPQKMSTLPKTLPHPPPFGIFSVAASINHSAALVRRPSGAIELYTWGRGEEGALGLAVQATATAKVNISPRQEEMSLPTEKHKTFQNSVHLFSTLIDQSGVSQQAVVTPTLISPVSFLSPIPSAARTGTLPCSFRKTHQHQRLFGRDTKGSASNNPNKQKLGSGSHVLSECVSHGETTSLLNPSEYLAKVSLGPSCTHVITSNGRWLAFGTSADGLLGLGKSSCSTDMPVEVIISLHEKIAAISVGDKHAVAVSNQGDALVWGRSLHGVFGQSKYRACSLNQIVSSPQSNPFFDCVRVGSVGIELDNKLIHHIHSKPSLSSIDDSSSSGKVAYAHTGPDVSIFVQEAGSVLSCGRQSGWLGQG